MGLTFDYNPAPKPVKKEKEKPKFKPKRPKKKYKKLETVKGRTIPPAKVRGSISKKEYEKAIEAFGRVCVICNDPYIEMHHIQFRSQQGRGQFRNLIPLCKAHHGLAHTSRFFADGLREERIEKYGNYYWADKFDLFKEKLIQNTTDECFESFMKLEEMKQNGREKEKNRL
jgi:hypothetical protein